MPILKATDAPVPRRTLHWQTGEGKDTQWAVRDGDWKLLANVWDTSSGVLWGTAADRNKEKIPLFLADLAEDPEEEKNLAEQRPEVVAQLKELHQKHLSDLAR